MKKTLLFLVTTAAIIFSSMLTAFADSVTEPVNTAKSFDFKLFLQSFVQSNAAIISTVVCVVLFLIFIVCIKKLKPKLDNSNASQMTNAFIALFSISGIACLAMAFATDGATWANLMHINPERVNLHSQFEDYINSVKSAATLNFYKTATINTPFSHLIYFILAQFLPPKFVLNPTNLDYIRILKNQTFMYLYFLLVTFCVVLLYRMHRSVLRNNSLHMRDEVVAFLMAVSFPTVYCIEKGSIAGLSFVFLMFFIISRKSEKSLFRELSYISLAVSAAITPYTLIFALLLFDTKNKKSIQRFVRTVLYFLILFITPGVFTGFGNILTYAKNFINVSAEGFIPGNMSIANLLHFFGISNVVIIYAIVILTNLIAVLSLLILPNVWQKTAAAAYIILNIFSVSEATLAIFVFVPLTLLLSQKEHKAVNWAYMLTFALLVTPIPEWFRADSENFLAFLGSMGIENIYNANNLISLAAAQFILIILFSQTVALMKEKKVKNQAADIEQKNKSI